MTLKNQTKSFPVVPGALPGGLVRTRFFDGMFLSQVDLENEQRFWRMKRRLTNRALGEGVVWGLRVAWDASSRRFTLSPGYALDCCGNDLVVECPTDIGERALVDNADPLVQAVLRGEGAWHAHCPGPDVAEDGSREACLVLQYVECPEAPQPVYRDACTTDVTHCEPARVRETTRVLLVPPPAPPPPSPVETFCQSVDELREKLGLPGEPIELPIPGFTEELEFVPARIELRLPDGDSIRVEPRLEQSVEVSLPPRQVPASGDDTAPQEIVSFRLSAQPAWLFYQARVLDAAGNEVAAMDPGHAAAFELSWSLSFVPATQPEGGEVPFSYEIPDFGVTMVLSELRHRLGLRIEGVAVARRFEDNNGTTWELRLDRARIDVVNRPELDPVTGTGACAEHLEGVIFAGDPACAAKTLLLSAVYGWLRSMLGEDSAGWTGRRVLASWMHMLMWRLFFDIDLTEDKKRQFPPLLQQLFASWCNGMLYPGPRCHEEHHGVFLGCVRISQAGRIIDFDPLMHRRHVVTGALLAHWGQQFGLAPIDVVVGRVVRTICCVAGLDQGADLVALPDPLDLINGDDGDGGGGQDGGGEDGKSGAAFSVGPSMLYVGDKQRLDARLASRGIAVTREENVSLVGLLALIHEQFTQGSMDARMARAQVRYTEPRLGIQLLVPTDGPPPADDTRGAVEALVRATSWPVGAVAKAPMQELVVELLEGVPVERLRSLIKRSDAVQVVSEALRARGITTAGRLLGTGAESVLLAIPAVRRDEPVVASLDAVFADGEQLLEALVRAVVESSQKLRPFVRARLSEDATAERLTKTLEGIKVLDRPLALELVRAAAQRVAARVPAG
jgi:hypothetical protein